MYNQDFYGWTQQQAKYLLAGQFDAVDKTNLIEELFSLGRSEKRALKSYYVVLFKHQLKKIYQAEEATRSWDQSIKQARLDIEDLLEENPSLKPLLSDIQSEAYRKARREAALETGLDESVFPEELLKIMED